MSYENLYLAKCIMDQRVNATLNETETRRMLREADIDHRHGVVRRVRRWLHHLGQRLGYYKAPMEGHHAANHSQAARL